MLALILDKLHAAVRSHAIRICRAFGGHRTREVWSSGIQTRDRLELVFQACTRCPWAKWGMVSRLVRATDEQEVSPEAERLTTVMDRHATH